jgi:hypothetical protein
MNLKGNIFLFYLINALLSLCNDRNTIHTSHKRIRDEAERNYIRTAGISFKKILNSASLFRITLIFFFFFCLGYLHSKYALKIKKKLCIKFRTSR